MENYNLTRAYWLILKKFKTPEDAYNSHWYKCRIHSGLATSYHDWAFGTRELLDIKNWNISRLTQGENGLRRPILYTNVYITSKDNLVLDWSPHYAPQSLRKDGGYDWKHWSDYWEPGRMPANRLLMVRKFNDLRFDDDFDQINRELILATQDLIKTIYTFLGYFIDVVPITGLYLKDDESYKTFKDFEIREVAEVEKERDYKIEIDWINSICNEFETCPETVVKTFKETASSYAPTARTFSKGKNRLSVERLKKLLRKIYIHTDIYEKYFDDPPKGVGSKNAEVIPFPGINTRKGS